MDTVHEHCSRGFRKKKSIKKIKFLFEYDLIYGILSCITYECIDVVYEMFFFGM